MEENNRRRESALTKSLSLVIERSPTQTQSPEEPKDGKLGTHSYNFLATLRKVKKLNTENIQKMYKTYNMVRFLMTPELIAQQSLQLWIAIVRIRQNRGDCSCL